MTGSCRDRLPIVTKSTTLESGVIRVNIPRTVDKAIADLTLWYSAVCLLPLAGAVCVDANGSAYQSFEKHVLFKKVDNL